MRRPLILVGGGGHCKSVIDVAESAGYSILGILDKPEEVGKTVLNYNIIGTDDDIPKYVGEADFVITVGQIRSSAIRQRIVERIRTAGGRLATIIAPDAVVSRYASIGEGTVVMHQCVVNAVAVIGRNCIINTMADIEHEVVIGDFCHISTGVMVNGNCRVGRNVFIGSRTVVYNGIDICDDTVVAAGSVVHRNICTAGTYAGCPVMKLK